MIDWKTLVENGKQCGIEYHFYDDKGINLCSCGGKVRMYSKENRKKKHTFEHLRIVCEECNKSIFKDYDISGNPDETYRPKDETMEKLVKEWNNQNK